MTSELFRIVIVDDHPLLLDGIKNALAHIPEFEIVGTGSSHLEAVMLSQTLKPDIMILDIGIQGGGLEAALQIAKTAPAIRIIMFTASDRADHVNAALAAGVMGYVLKGARSAELCECIRTVGSGKRYITPELAMTILSPTKVAVQPKDNNPGPLAKISRKDFTSREIDVIQSLSAGKNNKEIAEELNLSEKTVKHHMSNIMEKLQVKSRLSAALILSQWKD